MALYLCVDCGGSKTAAAIANESGEIIGRAFGGPSNFAYLGVDAFSSSVATAVGEALKSCISPPSQEPVSLPPTSVTFAAAWFGISGVDSPAAVAAITPVISKLLGIPAGPRLIVANDTHLLAAPVRLHPEVSCAVAVIGGTGSISVSFKESNGVLEELGRIGGWGWILGDEGGGFHVGREAIRQLLLEHDKASVTGKPPPHSSLRTRIMNQFSITDFMEILTLIHLPERTHPAPPDSNVSPHVTIPREKRLSSLSPMVFEAAFEDKDPLAISVLRICSDILADEVSVLLYDEKNPQPRAVKASESIVSFGGSLVGVAAYRDMILDSLANKGHVFHAVEFVDDAAAVGAVGLAAAKPV
ncbi:N-acetyl-D-glucosamine kinase [Pleurotus pulmonarius]|nr:hypothetical protein EYR38_006514 [Pleurotus pulmonarius]